MYRLIGQLDDTNDVDILIPDIYLKDKFIELLKIMEEAGYKQDPTHAHEFTKGEDKIGFEPESELIEDKTKGYNILKSSITFS